VKVTILTEKDIRNSIGFEEKAIQAIENGYSQLSSGNATLPPIMRIDIPENNGEVDVKTAYIKGLDRFAIKIAAGFFDNYKFGLPTGSGIMLIISAVTGNVEAILLDNGYLTDLRTGIAGAIAAKYLAREKVETAGVIGTGMQARYQIRGLRSVREFKKVLVYGIIPEEVKKYVSDMENELGIEVIASDSAKTVVQNSDVVVTTTPSKDAYLQPGWLHPGLHITCMGSDSPHKQEIHSKVFDLAIKIVCDSRDQCFILGELHHALDAGIITKNDEIFEIGEITSGKIKGRTNDEEITICDLTGVGVQDTQIALLAFEKAMQRQCGIVIDS